MARRLKTLAKVIAGMGYKVELQEGYCNTDRHIKGTRLRIPGKGRWGTRLLVKNKDGDILLDHNSAETYRSNQEVEEWINRTTDAS